jgi:hypothetical protein
VLKQFKRLGADFEQQTVKVNDASLEGDWVVVDYEWIARGVGSGLENRMVMSAAFRVVDGLLREAHYRWNRADALKAAGLPAEKT